MTQRIPCRICGELILPTTAVERDGRCVPCAGGYRERIDQSKRENAEARKRKPGPDEKLWTSLVQRATAKPDVVGGPSGYAQLSSKEKLFYSVHLLRAEVYNGGFEQYFSNSSADHYLDAVRGLEALGAVKSLAALTAAHRCIFGSLPVPATQVERNQFMYPAESELSPLSCADQLEALDTAFYAEPDRLGMLLDEFAVRQGLLAPFTDPEVDPPKT